MPTRRRDGGSALSGDDNAAIVDVLYSAACEPGEWPTAIAVLARHLGAMGGMLVRNARAPDRSSCIVGGMDPEISARYVEEYSDNPWTRAAASVPIGEVAVLSQLYDPREGRKLGWYADVLQPTHTREMTFLALRGFTTASSVGGLAFCHYESGTSAVEEAVHRLRELQPHLTRAVWLSQKVDQSRILGRQLDDMVNSSSRPVLMLSAAHRVIGMNPATEGFLRWSGFAVDGGGRLRASSPTDDDALQAAIARAAWPVHAGGDAPMSVPANTSTGRSVRLVLTPLPRHGVLPVLDPEGHAAVLAMVVDPHGEFDAKIDSLATTYGLTASEARVAGLLATGMGREHAADRLHVSVETIKKHTAACYRKIGLHSQAGLAHVVASLPTG